MLVEYGSVFIMLAIVLGLYMTWGIGANDVANAMGTSVGSGAITIKQAIIIAAIFEFAGAFIAGGNVTKTIRKGIIDPTPILGNPEILVWGMLSALLAAALWLTIASWMGWPVSTTHSIIGAIVGFAMVGIGMDAVNWPKIGTIVISWVVSPMVGGTFSYIRPRIRMLFEYSSVFIMLAIVLGLYMTWGIGANDVANSVISSPSSSVFLAIPKL